MIVLDRVCKTLGAEKRPVVREVSFEVPDGKMLVLLGRAGCGKTTTLKMINRLIEPTSGRISIDGQDIQTIDPVQLRRRVSLVFQGVGLFPHLSVADNIAVVPRLLGWPQTQIDTRTDELLAMVALPPAEYRQRMPRELSGGQQQRVGFARALAARPRVLLLDEPFDALDPVTRDEVRDEFLRLRRELGLTSVMVTHDMTEGLLCADLLAVMDGGQLLQIGTPRELLTRPAHPFVAALMATPRRQALEVEQLMTSGSQEVFA